MNQMLKKAALYALISIIVTSLVTVLLGQSLEESIGALLKSLRTDRIGVRDTEGVHSTLHFGDQSRLSWPLQHGRDSSAALLVVGIKTEHPSKYH